MKLFLDFLPMLFFFFIYKLYDLYIASGALIISSFIVLLYTKIRYKTVKKFSLITFVLMLVFSSLALYFHNIEFIKWKVTITYIIFSGILLFSQFVLGKPITQKIFCKEITLPIQVLSTLNLAWAIFFLLCGIVNIYVAFWLPQDIWVNFKVFGLTVTTLIFTILSSIYVNRYSLNNKKK